MLLQFIVKASTPGEILAQAKSALESGIKWLEIDAPDTVDDVQLTQVVEEIRPLLADDNCVLILANRPSLAVKVKADGVHIYDTSEPVGKVRTVLDAWPILGVNVDSMTRLRGLRPFDIDYFFFPLQGKESLPLVTEMTHYLDKEDIEAPLVVGGNLSPDLIPAVIEAGAAAIAIHKPDDISVVLPVVEQSAQKNI